ncbi:metallo-beta-lactamase domain protein [Peptoanaerobacter stomatis]|uniref:Metallo-beta-lactamase domain protein n=2 Tax=Peptoanaerobacter stomatis TaxID=796937 RepID=J6HQP2_9FIRM|nr:metallo-beta-lactamase domain protein [Peptoanaerobacter stomatis]
MIKKIMKKINLKQKIIIILLLTSLIYTLYQKLQDIYNPSTTLQVHFIDVGQGDSTLIITPDKKTVLIDAGDEQHSSRTTGYIKSQGIDKLDLVIATHPDADHIGGMDKVIKNFDIGMFSMPLVSKDTKQYKEIKKELKNKKLKNKPLYTGDGLSIGKDVKLQILSPQKNKTYSDTNEYSIVARLLYKEVSFLFMADATMENEIAIINDFDDIRADVLKLGHHGSSTSTSDYFLGKVNPSIGVISCGKNNKYGHPHKEVMNLLEKYNIMIFRTDEQGSIVLYSDGYKIYSRRGK